MAISSYTVHGLRVRSEISLPLRQSSEERQPDIDIRRAGSVPVPDDPPAGASYGSLGEAPSREWWTLDDETWRIRIAGCCELRIGPPWCGVEVDVDPGGSADVIADRVLKTGVLFALERQGRHVLHASAVRIRDVTIALVGPSGSGKSTLAALLCADGAALVSDDQLRIEFPDDEEVICQPGVNSIRLRPQVQEVASLLGHGGRPSWDGRTTVMPGVVVVEPQRLDVLAFPVVAAEPEDPRVAPLSPAEAMLALVRTRATPRVRSWVHARFHANANVVERLPAFRIRLPLGSVPTRLEREALLEPLLAATAYK